MAPTGRECQVGHHSQADGAHLNVEAQHFRAFQRLHKPKIWSCLLQVLISESEKHILLQKSIQMLNADALHAYMLYKDL